jgi:predicted PurR-regulated permease PerM
VNELQRLHIWQFQAVRDALWLIGIAAALWFGYIASVVTVPLLLGMLLAYLVEPLLTRAGRLHPALSRGRVVGGMVAMLIAGLLAMLVLVVPAVVHQAERAVSARGTYAVAITRLAEHERMPEALRPALLRAAEMLADQPQAKGPETVPPATDTLDEARVRALVAEEVARLHPAADSKRPLELAGQALSVIGTVIGSVFAVGLGVFLTMFFFVAFSVSWPTVQAFLLDCVPPQHRERTLQLARAMDGVVSGFVRGRLTIATMLCLLFMLGWWIADVPNALLLGLLTGIATLVPYLSVVGLLAAYGFLIAAAMNDPASVPFYADAEGIRWTMLLILPAIPPAIGQIVDDYVLTPMIQGKATNLSTPTVVAAVVAGGAVAGLYGMLLAIPVAGCTRILLIEVVAPRLRAWWHATPPAA